MADSEVALERRSAITGAFWLIRSADLDDPLELAAHLARDESAVVTKPVGTALREVGKVDQDRLIAFLGVYGADLPRHSLRLATSKLSDGLRRQWL